MYIDGLILLLRKSGLGCRINTFYYGVLGYADDLLLMSSSRSGLQAMVTICEEFAKLRKLKFSTHLDPAKSKTKCLIFSKVKSARDNVAPIILNGDPLPWVDSVKHLGNLLEFDNSMKTDCVLKRGKFIGKINSLLQEFHYVEPQVMIKLINIYCTSFYGSSLWDIYSKKVTRIFSSWNVTIRNIFNLPWTTHRYLIEGVSGTTHPKTMMCGRYIRFLETLSTCSKLSVRFLAGLVHDDRRTLTGKTVTKIADDCSVDRNILTPGIANRSRYSTPPVEEQWRLSILMELLEVRAGLAFIPGADPAEIQLMIENICCN